jgi:hypothetical protein
VLINLSALLSHFPRPLLSQLSPSTRSHWHTGARALCALSVPVLCWTRVRRAGGFAERVTFAGVAVYFVMFTLVIYCPLAHMVWHPEGLIRKAGIIDFAGGECPGRTTP